MMVLHWHNGKSRSHALERAVLNVDLCHPIVLHSRGLAVFSSIKANNINILKAVSPNRVDMTDQSVTEQISLAKFLGVDIDILKDSFVQASMTLSEINTENGAQIMADEGAIISFASVLGSITVYAATGTIGTAVNMRIDFGNRLPSKLVGEGEITNVNDGRYTVQIAILDPEETTIADAQGVFEIPKNRSC